MMPYVAFYVYGTEWARRTEMFTGTAPDAEFFVDHRNL